MARDRPSPYGEGRAFFHRRAGACPPRGASKPIKDLKDLMAFCISAAIDMQDLKDLKRTRDVFFRARPLSFTLASLVRCLSRWLRSPPCSSRFGDLERGRIWRSCPTGSGAAWCVARDRPSSYGEGRAFFHRSAGACPPRVLGHPNVSLS